MADSFDATDTAVIMQNLDTSIAALRASNETSHQMLGTIAGIMQGISHMLAKEYEQQDLVTNVTLNINDTRLDRQGRRFLVVFSPVTITGVIANVLGLTGYTFTLAAGWTTLNLPDGSIIKAPTGTSQGIIIKATNWLQAGAV